MPPVRGHPKTFLLFDPSDTNDDDDSVCDDMGMPPLIENPFSFASTTSSDATEYAPTPGSFKYTFEHDLINADDGLPPLVDHSDRPQSITFAPPYIPPPPDYFLQPLPDHNSAEQLDMPPLVEAPATQDKEGYEFDDEFPNQTPHPFAADMESAVLQSRDVKDPSYIPRPPNAFILFRSSFIKGQKDSGAFSGSKSLAKTVSLAWRNLPPNERAEWEAKALVAQAEHREKYPDWRFNHATGDGKRRTKKVKDGPLSKGPRKGVGGRASLQGKNGKLAKGKGKEHSERLTPPSASNSEGGQTAVGRPPEKTPLVQTGDSPSHSSDSPRSVREEEGVQEVLRVWERIDLLPPNNVTGQSQGHNLNNKASSEPTREQPVQEAEQNPPEPTFTALPVAITSLPPEDEYPNFVRGEPQEYWASDESASPPPTSPFLDSDSVRSSPRSPFGTLFGDLHQRMTTETGPTSVSSAGRLSGIEFALPPFAATRALRPAVAVANMYNLSTAGQPPPSTNSLPAYYGTPLSSNPTSETEELREADPSNDAKSPLLKRSSSAPAPRDRRRSLFPPSTVVEGAELGTNAFHGQPTTNASARPGLREIPVSLTEQRRQSVSETGSRVGAMPRVPPSPTKRNRNRGQNHVMSPPIRGPRRLIHQARRESFSGHYPSSTTHHEYGWATAPAADETFPASFYNYGSHSVQPGVPYVLGMHSAPVITTSQSLPILSHPHFTGSGTPSSVRFPRPPASEQGPLNSQMPNDPSTWYASGGFPSTGSSPVAPGFGFGFTPSSSFSSLANWDGEGGNTSTRRH